MLFLTLWIITLAPTKCLTGTWWDSSEEGPVCAVAGTCGENDKTCECFLTIKHQLTMMTSPEPVLVWPKGGQLYLFDDNDGTSPLPKHAIKNTITADGVGSRMVITVNGLFPGPSIVAFEGQQMIMHVQNLMQTEATAIHWHGMEQINSVYSDGVPFITQCPILPGQNSTYRFTASPKGTHFYHSLMGNQRSMGLYGALIINPKKRDVTDIHEGFTVLLQDWNHNDDPETSYLRMIDGVYDFNTKKYENSTHSVDGTNFSAFRLHSGLINGMGRFYKTKSTSNESPLQVFEIEQSKPYLFRVISAATLYPFRVFIQGHPTLTMEASDGHDIVNNVHTASDKLIVESFIIYPGERFDFTLYADQEPGSYLFVAETLEVLGPSVDEYHAAEAILHYANTPNITNPQKATSNTCSPSRPCKTFNCPFLYYPQGTNRICLNFDKQIHSKDTESLFKEVYNVSKTLFFNFGFNGDLRFNPGSVNGHQFVFPAEPILYRHYDAARGCEKANCGQDTVCQCTFYERVDKGIAYQLVLSNIGDGQGWSQPIHLHGYNFFVVKMGFGIYDNVSAMWLRETNDIRCDGRMKPSMCNSERWNLSSWDNPNSITGVKLKNPPIKDTIVIPSGGYVIIRLKASNPGPWFFHSQVDLHTTYGMAMVFHVGPYSASPMLANPQTCWVQRQPVLNSLGSGNGLVTGLAVSVAIEGIVIGIGIIYCIKTNKCQKFCIKSKKIPKDCLDSHPEDKLDIYPAIRNADFQTLSQHIAADNDYDDTRNIIDSEETTEKILRPYM